MTEFSQSGETHTTRVLENVSSDEYKACLKMLRDFSETSQEKLKKVGSLQELTEVTRGIGPALRAVIISKGKSEGGWKTTWKDSGGTIVSISEKPAEYELFREVGGNKIHARVSKGFISEELVSISYLPTIRNTYSLKAIENALSHSGRGVSLYSDKPIILSEDTGVNYNIAAYEEQDGNRVWYYPLIDQNNSKVQQNYARVLQTCVKDILSLNLPPPNEVPATFYQ